MARRSRIETLSLENDILEMSAKGMGVRKIAKALSDKIGEVISPTAVQRFLLSEVKDRQAVRRAVTAKKAAEIAGNAGEDADANLDALRSVIKPLGLMATRHVRRVSFPDEAKNLRPAQEASEAEMMQQLARIDEGQREWWEPVAAKDAIRAASVLKDTAAYLVELAGANPRPKDAKSLEAIREAIAEAFGYSKPPEAADPMEAPPTAEEHTPPVTH
jgi:hypothetical protein